MREPSRFEPANRGILEEAAGKDDAGDASRPQRLQVGALSLGIAVRVAEQDAEPALPRRLLEALEDPREEAVGDVRDDHRQHEALPCLQPARQRVRLVARLLQQGLDALSGGRADPEIWVVVGNPRDGGRMDARAGRQLLQGRQSFLGLGPTMRLFRRAVTPTAYIVSLQLDHVGSAGPGAHVARADCAWRPTCPGG